MSIDTSDLRLGDNSNAIEKNQEWIGATLGIGFMLNSVRDALSESLVVPLFCQHFKQAMPLTFPYLTLDWVGRWKARKNPDLISTLETLKEKAPAKNKMHILNLPEEVLNASAELRKLFEQNILFVKRLDYPKFRATLPDRSDVGFDLATSGVLMQVEKKHVEYIDVFNYDPKEEPIERKVNIEIIS